MTITTTTCAALTQADVDFAEYVREAVEVVVGSVVEPLPGSSAMAVALFEVIHVDALCRAPLADACLQVVAQDRNTRFVAPDAAAVTNYVSYWHRESPPTAEKSGWAPLTAGQESETHEVRILGQTLPAEIAAEAGAGFLHYVGGLEGGNGWTVAVGVTNRVRAVTGLILSVELSARAYATPSTVAKQVVLPPTTP